MEYQDVDLDQHFSEIENEELLSEEEDLLAALTAEEKALLKKIEEKQRMTDPVIKTFNEMKSRPSDEEIDALKAQVGDVFLASFSETENFLFRPLKRLEWRTLMGQIQKLDDLKKSEAIVQRAVLHPKLTQQNINVLTAGGVETLKELILQASNFMGPEIAMQLVRKL